MAVAKYVEIHITCKECDVKVLKDLSPLAKSLILSFSGRQRHKRVDHDHDHQHHIPTSLAMMRAIATITPISRLLGNSVVDDAKVDGWLSFIWSSIDLPFYVISKAGTERQENHAGTDDNDENLPPTPAAGVSVVAKQNLDGALEKIDIHLIDRTYMVGDHVTLVDISLSISIAAASEKHEDDILRDKANLQRWLNNLSTN